MTAPKKVTLISGLLALAITTGCNQQSGTSESLQSNISPDVSVSPDTDSPLFETSAAKTSVTYVHPRTGAECYIDSYVQPNIDAAKKLDILFVVDSSDSLKNERGQIGVGIKDFIAELPEDANYQTAVILAHSNDATSGRLYNRMEKDPMVISSTSPAEEIQRMLRDRMHHVEADPESNGGEAGLYSLSRALDADRLAEARSHGFFRDDAALAIVFVSDGPDVCSKAPPGFEQIPDPNGDRARAFDKYCSGINAEGVYSKVKNFAANRPLLITGIINNGTNPISKNDPTWKSGGKGLGGGYLDMIEFNNSESADLADKKGIAAGLAEIGVLAAQKLELITEFQLDNKVNVDLLTLRVLVDDGAVEFDYLSTTHQLTLLGYAGQSYSTVDIEYCNKIINAPPSDDGGDDTTGGGDDTTGGLSVSDYQVTDLTAVSFQIDWTTTEASISYVIVREPLSGRTIRIYSNGGAFHSEHSVIVYDLLPNTAYDVTIVADTGAETTSVGPILIRTIDGERTY